MLESYIGIFGSTRKYDRADPKLLLSVAKNNIIYCASDDSGQPENFRVHQNLAVTMHETNKKQCLNPTFAYSANPKIWRSGPENFPHGCKKQYCLLYKWRFGPTRKLLWSTRSCAHLNLKSLQLRYQLCKVSKKTEWTFVHVMGGKQTSEPFDGSVNAWPKFKSNTRTSRKAELLEIKQQ